MSESSKHFLELPAELRNEIIDEMQPDDRCRFTRTSSQCCSEVKSSLKYLHALEICAECEKEDIYIFVTYGKCPGADFTLKFGNNNEDLEITKHMLNLPKISITPDDKKHWQIDLAPSTDLLQLAIDHFKKLLKCYQRSIKRLTVCGIFPDFEVTNLNNLEQLTVIYDRHGPELLSKTRRPLKKVFIYEDEPYGNYHHVMSQICQVQHRLWMRHLGFNNEQFRQLSATHMQIDIGELTPEDIFEFIRSWQNGTITRKMEYCNWDIPECEFDGRQLLGLLGVDYLDGPHRMTIKHDRDIRKSAQLVYEIWSLSIIFENAADVGE